MRAIQENFREEFPKVLFWKHIQPNLIWQLSSCWEEQLNRN